MIAKDNLREAESCPFPSRTFGNLWFFPADGSERRISDEQMWVQARDGLIVLNPTYEKITQLRTLGVFFFPQVVLEARDLSVILAGSLFFNPRICTNFPQGLSSER
jgi:hypothetical protein